MTSWALMIQEAVTAMLVKIWSYVPNLAAAVVIFLAGWIIAKILEAVVVKVLGIVKVDLMADKSGLNDVLKKGDIRKPLSELLGAVVYWLVMLVVIVTAVQTLQLNAAANLVSRLVSYVPNVIAAIFVLVLGGFLAALVGSIVQTAAANARLRKARTLAQLSRVAVLVLTISVALEQLQIAAVVTYAVNILVASMGLGLAIAFGLGCKELVGGWVSDFIKSLKS